MTTKETTRMAHESAGIHLRTTPLHFRRILFTTDFSSHALLAFKFAAQLSKHFGSKLYMMHVISSMFNATGRGVITPLLREVEVKHAQEELSHYFARTYGSESIEREEIIVSGIPKDLIPKIAVEKQIDLVVMGSHGRGGIGKLALGSVAEWALRHLHCPVLVCGPHCKRSYHGPGSIMLATNLSFGALRPAQYASAMADEFHAQLTVVHIAANGEIDLQRRRALKAIDELIPATPELRKRARYSIRSGNPSSELLRVARPQKVNLIVIGVEERGTMADHAPWATISKVIREASCPVLAVQSHIA